MCASTPFPRVISFDADVTPLVCSQLASKKHRESASYLYDAHGSGSSKGTMRERSSRYSNRHKVCCAACSLFSRSRHSSKCGVQVRVLKLRQVRQAMLYQGNHSYAHACRTASVLCFLTCTFCSAVESVPALVEPSAWWSFAGIFQASHHLGNTGVRIDTLHQPNE